MADAGAKAQFISRQSLDGKDSGFHPITAGPCPEPRFLDPASRTVLLRQLGLCRADVRRDKALAPPNSTPGDMNLKAQDPKTAVLGPSA